MSNCQTITTGTQTDLVTSTITTTTFSLTTSTPDPVTSTFTTTSCVASLGGVCGSTTEIVETTTIPGTPTTISSPVTLTTQTTATSLITLLGTRCTSDPNPRTSNPPSNNSPTPQPNPNTTPNTSASPTTALVTSTGADGSVVTLTVTESAPGSTPTNTSTDAGVQNGNSGGGGDRANIGAIVGGTVGGVVGIIGIVLIIWFILKRRRRWDDIFDDDATTGGDPFTANIAKHHGKNNTSRFSLTQDLEDEPKGPRPYQYGLVGHVPSPSATSPPNSPPVNAAVGHKPVPPLQLPANGMYQPGLTASGPPTSNTLVSSRPSTAGSMQPLTYPPPQSNNHSSRSGSGYTHTTSPSITQPPLQHAQSYGFVQAPPPPQPSEFDPYSSYPNHVLAPDRGATGSPMSVQYEPRKLQVANQRNSTDLGASVSPSGGVLAERSTSPTAGRGGLAYMD